MIIKEALLLFRCLADDLITIDAPRLVIRISEEARSGRIAHPPAQACRSGRF